MPTPLEVMEFVETSVLHLPVTLWEPTLRGSLNCDVASGSYKYAALLPSYVVKWAYNASAKACLHNERLSYESLTKKQRRFVVPHRFYDDFIVSPRALRFVFDSRNCGYTMPDGTPLTWDQTGKWVAQFASLFGHDAAMANLGIYQNRIVALELNGHEWTNSNFYKENADAMEDIVP